MYKNILILKIIFLTLLVFHSNSNLKAEPYQFEIAGGYEYAKDDDTKTSLYQLGGSIYFEQITTEGRPLAEASFLQKAGYISFIFLLANSKAEDEYLKVNTDMYGIGAELKYVLPSIPLFVELGYSHMKADQEATITFYPWDFSDTQNINLFYGAIGLYLTDTLAIKGFGSKLYRKIDDSSSTEEDTEIAYGGELKYVLLLGNGMAFNLQAAYNHESLKEDGDSEKYITREYELLGDLYLTPGFSIGGGVQIQKGDIKPGVGKTYMAQARLFITENLSIGIQFQQFKVDDSNKGEDSRVFGVYVTGRI